MGVGEALVVWLEIETWVISKGGPKGGEQKGESGGSGRSMGAAGFWDPCVCLCVNSTVVVEGSCVRDGRRLVQ
jgi:hypothetical protein